MQPLAIVRTALTYATTVTQDAPGPRWYSAERFKAYVDAVVAIAMTLLILPLMEAVTGAATERMTTGEFLQAHVGQLFSFGLSFLLIATRWVDHHRLFDHVKRVSPTLVWLNVGWMFTIVWLPVATAIIGQLPSDPVQALVYVGTLVLTSLFMLAMRVTLLRTPAATTAPRDELLRGIAAEIAQTLLFTAVLVIAMLIPGYGYYAFFLLFLTRPVALPILAVIRRKWGAAGSGATAV